MIRRIKNWTVSVFDSIFLIVYLSAICTGRSEDSVQLHQAYNGTCNHRKQPRTEAIIFTKDAPSFDATDAVFHINALLGYLSACDAQAGLPVLQTLF